MKRLVLSVLLGLFLLVNTSCEHHYYEEHHEHSERYKHHHHHHHDENYNRY